MDENYPHPENLMGDVFVHVRVKKYAERHEVKVFSFFHEQRQLVYEGIRLEMFKDLESLVHAIKEYDPDKILIHFYQSWMLEAVIKIFRKPVIIWVHGYEALGWYRRLFNYSGYSPVLLRYIWKNTKQQYHFRKLIQYANKSIGVHFVFVSNWMRRVAEKDSLSKIKKYDIIPNPIDIELFQYQEKNIAMRKKILILRSFGSRKYANDISVKAILELSGRNSFKEFSFTIIGEGQLFEKTLQPLKNFTNIRIQKGAVKQVAIPAIHKEHGIFLCPTRQDAQGVSMCEAMSSGLVPIVSDNTAIPEFVTDNVSGLLTHSSSQIADALEYLLHNPDKFSQLSAQASQSMKALCAIDNITQKEFAIIES